ncbi:MAG: hypothetical protein VB144_02510 [Clostridia bacterium]|nr:hypothetical protein [Clostridia bacterium]
MFTVPDAIVRRIYVRGSLSNTQAGFAFKLKNTLVSGNLTGAGTMAVDGRDVPPADIRFGLGDTDLGAGDVSPSSPLSLPAGIELVVRVKGVSLEHGMHELHFPVTIKEVGPVTLSLTDEIP